MMDYLFSTVLDGRNAPLKNPVGACNGGLPRAATCLSFTISRWEWRARPRPFGESLESQGGSYGAISVQESSSGSQ